MPDPTPPPPPFTHAWDPATNTVHISVRPAGRSKHLWALLNGAWLTGGIFAISVLALLTSKKYEAVTFIYVVALLFSGPTFFMTSRSAFRVLRERWDVDITSTSFRITRNVTRRRHVSNIPINQTSRLLIGPFTTNFNAADPPTIATGLVLFSDAKTHWFAKPLQGKDAAAALSLILQRFPELGAPLPLQNT